MFPEDTVLDLVTPGINHLANQVASEKMNIHDAIGRIEKYKDHPHIKNLNIRDAKRVLFRVITEQKYDVRS
jgi:hypothetical protein